MNFVSFNFSTCRFIHDIIVATIRATGFPDGLFNPEELDSSNFKDSKISKVTFLDKLIHIVNVGHGFPLKVKSSKVIAGLEPLNTNLLLVAFGRIAQDTTLNRDNLIQDCLSGRGLDELHNSRQNKKSNESHGNSTAQNEESDVINTHSDEKKDEDSKTHRESTMLDENQLVSENNESDIPARVKRDHNESFAKQIEACNEDIDQTKLMISHIVTKPKCTDKLLRKPPFRFVHDLIMAIGHATQFDLGQIFR